MSLFCNIFFDFVESTIFTYCVYVTSIAPKFSAPQLFFDVGIFFDKVSKLSRIVNITDLSMSSAKEGKGILTKCVAKTFSAMSPEETAGPEKKTPVQKAQNPGKG